MNCIELFVKKVEQHSDQLAIHLPKHDSVTFADLYKSTSYAQLKLKQFVNTGDSVVVLDNLSPRLYSCVIGLLAMGCQVVFVEPWMKVSKIEKVISELKPKLFLTNNIGRLWALRVRAMRKIPHWVSTAKLDGETSTPLQLAELNADTPGILTFTSGTTGTPKGVVRKQGYLVQQHKVFNENLHTDQHQGPDLCIFANFVLANLASGRGSVIIPPKWKKSHLYEASQLRGQMQPSTLTCGPGFLLNAFHQPFKDFESIHVGGALTDCWIFEKGFKLWPSTEWTHIYGSSEAEPVALSDAKVAVEHSRNRGHFQTLYLGKKVPQIQPDITPNSLWISGPHVCPEYFGQSEENKLNKKRDAQNNVWHNMGDRISEDNSGWWYAGRSQQSIEDFKAEQALYAELQSSKGFIENVNNEKTLYLSSELQCPEDTLKRHNISAVKKVTIFRDSRHRARIDRLKSKKEKK